MLSLFDRCCERCSHQTGRPCPDFLACRLSGPFCHDAAACRRAREAIARRVAFGPAGEPGFSGPGGLVGVGQGDCGRGVGSEPLLAELGERLGPGFEVIPTGCLGYCSREPTVWLARPDGPQALYGPISGDEVETLAARLNSGAAWEEKIIAWLPPTLAAEVTFRDNRHLYSVEETAGDAYPFFLDRQMRLITAHCGLSRPVCLDDYLMRGGLHALFMLLRHYSADDAFFLLEDSLLVSRLSGEPVHSLWSRRAALGVETLLLDLSDAAANPAPLARRLLEGTPFAVLEALIVLGRLVGARRARVALPRRWEVPYADALPPGDGWLRYRPDGDRPVRSLIEARDELVGVGLLGRAVLGTDFDFEIEIDVGGPTGNDALEVELETILSLPLIVENGGEWFRGFGHGAWTGTKLMLVDGPLTAHGFCEVNLGTPLEDVIELVCGGGRPEPIDWARLDGGGRIPSAAFAQPLDYPGDEDEDEPLRAPSVLDCHAVITRLEAAPTAEESPAPGLNSLLSSYRQLPAPGGAYAPCAYAWHLVGQTLERLGGGWGEPFDLHRLEDWAKFLRYNADVDHGHWAEVLQNAIHSQGTALLGNNPGGGR